MSKKVLELTEDDLLQINNLKTVLYDGIWYSRYDGAYYVGVYFDDIIIAHHTGFALPYFVASTEDEAKEQGRMFYKTYKDRLRKEALDRQCANAMNVLSQIRCMKISKSDYKRYIVSSHWKEIAELIIYRDNYKCKDCGGTAYQVHHTTYIHLGRESLYPEDLVSLCGECHLTRHRMEKDL